MLKRFLKKFWKLLITIGVLLTVLQGVLNIFPKIYYFFVSCINKTSLSLNISSKLLLILIGLTVLCILALTLSLLCIFKKNKNSSDVPSKPAKKLPPKEYMNKILLRVGQESYLTQHQICSCFPDDDKTTIHHYIDLLCKSKYLQLKSAYTNTYELFSKGREYLVENNLLSKQSSHN